jgi:hypothetical protein
LITDTFGLEVQQKQFYHPGNYMFYANSIRPFQLLHDKYVLFSGHLSLAYQHNNGVLVKFNLSTKDTMWVKSYNQPGDSCEFFTSTFLADSSILVVGERYYLSNGVGYNKPFIMKTDKNGNYKWHKYLYNSWNSYSMLPHKIVKISENSFVIGGNKISNTQNGFILKTDTNANLIFDAGLMGITHGVINDIVELNDASILAIGSDYVYQDYTKKLFYQLNLNSGQKLKSVTYGVLNKSNGVLCANQNSSGTIFAGGVSHDMLAPWPTYHTANVLRLNSNLDSVSVTFIPIQSNEEFAPYSILMTKDGGFITTLFDVPYSITPKNWLIKADSTGCFEVNCSVNNSIEEVEKENGELMVWPNPAQSFIEVHFPNVIKSEYLNISIYNSLGQLVYKEEQTNLSETVKINTDKFASGLYHMQVKTKSASYDSKFIIQR